MSLIKNLLCLFSITIILFSLTYCMEEKHPLSSSLSPSSTPKTDRRTVVYKSDDQSDFDIFSSLVKTGNLEKLIQELNSSHTKIPLATILHGAIQEGQFSIVRYMIEQYNEEELLIDCRNEEQETPLIEAVRLGSFAMVNHLLCYGANVNAQSASGDSPLHKAAKFDRVFIAKLLLNKKYQTQIDIRNAEGKTPLLVAAQNASLETFALLQAKRAAGGVVSNNGENLLHLAVLSGYIPMLSRVLQTTDLDVNARTHNNETPLTIAQNNQDEAMKKILLWYQEKQTKNID